MRWVAGCVRMTEQDVTLSLRFIDTLTCVYMCAQHRMTEQDVTPAIDTLTGVYMTPSSVHRMTEQDVNDSPPVIGVLKDLLVFLVRYGLPPSESSSSLLDTHTYT